MFKDVVMIRLIHSVQNQCPTQPTEKTQQEFKATLSNDQEVRVEKEWELLTYLSISQSINLMYSLDLLIKVAP